MQTSLKITRAAADDYAPEFINRYIGRRWGYGHAANVKAARWFDVTPETVRLWRAGLSKPKFFAIAMILGFETLDRALDRVDPEGAAR